MKRVSRTKVSPARKSQKVASGRISVEPLLPVPIPHSTARLARGIRAGRWVFATGQAGTDYVNGLAPDVVQVERPFNGESHYKRESRRLYRNLKEVLAQASAGFPDIVRLDQYYTAERAMHPYHEIRHEVFGKSIPPSTSNLHQRFSRTGQTIEVQAIAAVPGAGLKVKHENFKPGYYINPVSGYSPALSAGDFRFVPGVTAESRSEGGGPLDPEVRHLGAMWRQWPISLKPTSSSSANSFRRSKVQAPASTASSRRKFI
jgi:enamine deaminase RidA (YjgF/YER057c/UK114 family)